jgi:hypothetical protein
MKRFWLVIVTALMFATSPAWALESSHDCADGNDQDLEAARQQTIKQVKTPIS